MYSIIVLYVSATSFGRNFVVSIEFVKILIVVAIALFVDRVARVGREKRDESGHPL